MYVFVCRKYKKQEEEKQEMKSQSDTVKIIF